MYAQRPWLVVGGYFAVFTLVTLFLPIAAPMTLVAGALATRHGERSEGA